MLAFVGLSIFEDTISVAEGAMMVLVLFAERFAGECWLVKWDCRFWERGQVYTNYRQLTRSAAPASLAVKGEN